MNKYIYELEDKLDKLDGNWWVWSCRRIDRETDELVEGTIQADGQQESIAYDTFEQD